MTTEAEPGFRAGTAGAPATGAGAEAEVSYGTTAYGPVGYDPATSSGTCPGDASGTASCEPEAPVGDGCTGGPAPAPGMCDEKAPASFAVARIARLHRMASGKSLRALGLYPGQEYVMIQLWISGASRQADLIKAADLDPSTVTKMLQRLEQAGHVRRRPDPADRRAVLVEATEASTELRTAVEAHLTELEEQLLTGLDQHERHELLRLLAKTELNLCRTAGECAPE